MSEPFKGVLAMILACTTWGLSALFYKAIQHVPPLEVLSHRTLWSLVVLLILLGFQGRLREIAPVLRGRQSLVIVLLASLLISSNWFAYIYAVQIGQVVESSLGYYIFPLMSVALGALVLRETLAVAQWVAVALALVAVVLLTYGLGVAPWLSLFLAGTFALYGLLKKLLAVGPVVSVTAEVLLLAPFALIWLWGAHTQGWLGIVGRDGGYFGRTTFDTIMLMLAGPMTGLPLVLMSYAMKRLYLSTVGVTTYINPTLQFLVAVLIFVEPFTVWHGIAFSLIWIGLALYSYEGWRQDRSR